MEMTFEQKIDEMFAEAEMRLYEKIYGPADNCRAVPVSSGKDDIGHYAYYKVYFSPAA